MANAQERSKRKVSGGIYKDYRKKKFYSLARDPTLTKVESKRVRKLRVRSGKEKLVLLSSDVANVFDPKEKKYKKAKIKTVLENPANRHYVRRNILTKGTIVDTELGKARIVNRPGQEAMVNAILIKN
jgi:small subunit ribosomal protein S8e